MRGNAIGVTDDCDFHSAQIEFRYINTTPTYVWIWCRSHIAGGIY
jgi:hypothetical protein